MKRFAIHAVTMLLAVAAFPPLAAAQQSPVAVIDVQRVVTESDPGKEVLGKLKKLQEQKLEQGKALQQELDRLKEQFSKQRFTLSDDKLTELSKKIEDKSIEMKRFQDDAQRELEDARRKALSDLEQRIMPIIQQLGKEKGYLLIFQKYQSGLVYADDARTDITDEVIRRFNTSQQ
jgi:outer membrane protein